MRLKPWIATRWRCPALEASGKGRLPRSVLSDCWLERPRVIAPLSVDSAGRNTGVGCHAPSGPGIEPRSPALQVDSLPSEPPGKPCRRTGDWNVFWMFPPRQRSSFNAKFCAMDATTAQPDIGRNDLRPVHLTASLRRWGKARMDFMMESPWQGTLFPPFLIHLCGLLLLQALSPQLEGKLWVAKGYGFSPLSRAFCHSSQRAGPQEGNV